MSYSSKKSAEREASRLRRKGYSVFIKKSTKDGKRCYTLESKRVHLR